MRIFIIGGTGFIGAHVTRRLFDAGHELTVFHRGRTSVELPAQVDHIFGVRDDLKFYRDEVEAAAPEVVIDMIPMTETDAERTMGMFRGLAEHVVAVSSGDVYRNYNGMLGRTTVDPDPVPLSENAPLRRAYYPYRDVADGEDDPLYHYDKILVERAFRSAPDLPATVVRLPMVYGEGDPRYRLWPYLKRMLDGRPAILLGTAHAGWRTARGYVRNVADAIATAATDPDARGRIYNVGELTSYTERQWVERLGEAAGWDGEVVTLPGEDLPAALRPSFNPAYELALDTSRFREAVGYAEATAPGEAVRRTVAWVCEHPPQEPVTGTAYDATFDYDAEDEALG